jgi:hypothetical protein
MDGAARLLPAQTAMACVVPPAVRDRTLYAARRLGPPAGPASGATRGRERVVAPGAS